jgi:hypothetical protein
MYEQHLDITLSVNVVSSLGVLDALESSEFASCHSLFVSANTEQTSRINIYTTCCAYLDRL